METCAIVDFGGVNTDVAEIRRAVPQSIGLSGRRSAGL
jgi:hypothetical protein